MIIADRYKQGILQGVRNVLNKLLQIYLHWKCPWSQFVVIFKIATLIFDMKSTVLVKGIVKRIILHL